jgi:hypothetical protein
MEFTQNEIKISYRLLGCPKGRDSVVGVLLSNYIKNIELTDKEYLSDC